MKPLHSIVLEGATAITPFRCEKNCTLVLEGGNIAQMGNIHDTQIPRHAERIDASGYYVMPGFIDIHVHGGGGFDFSDSADEAIEQIERIHASHGTTTLLATLYPQPPERLLDSISRIRRYCEQLNPTSIVEGIHLEGPFLNPIMPGVLRPEYMWPATVHNFHQLVEAGGSWIKVMTVAPCIPGGLDVLRAAALTNSESDSGRNGRSSIHLSIGHSAADYAMVKEAIDCGLAGVTHIYNAMQPMHHRHPGVLTASLLHDELSVEAIADAIHVHPANLQLLMKIKGIDRIVLVTDAIRAAGMPEGVYSFSGREVKVHQGRAYLTASPETLAGSTLTMERAVRTMVQHTHATLEEAAQMAGLNAARILELSHRRGVLAVGKEADLVMVDSEFNVKLTIKAGRIIFREKSVESVLPAPFQLEPEPVIEAA